MGIFSLKWIKLMKCEYQMGLGIISYLPLGAISAPVHGQLTQEILSINFPVKLLHV